jgi:hypothetical protein
MERVNLSLSAGLLQIIDGFARNQRFNRSEAISHLVGEAMEQRILLWYFKEHPAEFEQYRTIMAKAFTSDESDAAAGLAASRNLKDMARDAYIAWLESAESVNGRVHRKGQRSERKQITLRRKA